MNDRTDWRSWITPILEHAIATGKSEDEAVCSIHENYREEVRKLYRAIKGSKRAETTSRES